MPYIPKYLYNDIENVNAVHELLNEFYGSDIFLCDPAVISSEIEEKLRSLGENRIADLFVAGKLQ